MIQSFKDLKNTSVKRSLTVSSDYEKKMDVDNTDKGFHRNRSDFDNMPHKGNREFIYCKEKRHTSLFECEKFKVVDSMTRFRFFL